MDISCEFSVSSFILMTIDSAILTEGVKTTYEHSWNDRCNKKSVN